MVDDELDKLDGGRGSGSGSYPIRGRHNEFTSAKNITDKSLSA